MAKPRRLFVGVVLAFIVFFGGALSLYFSSLFQFPDFSKLRTEVQVTYKLKNGKVVNRWVGPKVSGWVPLSEISNPLISAVISAEDTTFFSHQGIDIHEVKESIKKDFKEKRWARGASTITQQVVKNVYLSSEKTLTRKIRELIWAHALNRSLTKSEILCFYLNLVEWGPGIYGIREASKYYYEQSPSQTSAKQAAFLAMLLPAPRKYHVYFKDKKLTRWAEKRVGQILRTMFKLGYLEKDELEVAFTENLWERPEEFTDSSYDDFFTEDDNLFDSLPDTPNDDDMEINLTP